MGEEISDVQLYLLRLAEVLGVEVLPGAAQVAAPPSLPADPSTRIGFL